MSNNKISNEEWLEISNELEPHHAVFYKVWQMGRPIFDENIPTACVQFDKDGNFIVFRFNPSFWNSLNLYNKLFVICHEALHIVLNHGIRAKDSGCNQQATNVAMDVVVNHTLVRGFGFSRKLIANAENYCWVDTVFKNNDPLPSDNENFEYYYNLFDQEYTKPDSGESGSNGQGDEQGDSNFPSTVDDHSGLGDQSSDWGEVIDQLNNELSDEEKKTLESTIKKHFQSEPKSVQPGGTPAGDGTGGQWVFISGQKPKKKKKWETCIKKWAMNSIKNDDFETEQWVKLNRRMSLLGRNLLVPSDMEIEDRHQELKKIDVWFFLDTSGSCWDLKDRFFAAAESLPEERFSIRLFCFDTMVQETDLKERKVYGGGGTSFLIIEKHIQDLIKKESCKYPSSVWIITDGYGDSVKPQHPDRWNWFLTDDGHDRLLPKESIKYKLKDYE